MASSHYDERVVKQPRLAEVNDRFDIKVSSLTPDLGILPDVEKGKASIVLKGKFEERPVVLRKISSSLRNRALRDLKVMDRTQDLCQTANYHLHLVHNDSSIILMPLYEHNLEQYLQSRDQLTKRSEKNIIYQIALGLSELHKRGIIHTDLRPSKIFIQGSTGNERIILSNFRRSKVDGTSSELVTKSQFADSTVRDKVQPNVCDKADLFSLGMIAYYIWSYHDARGDAFRTFPCSRYAVTNMPRNKIAEKNLLTKLLGHESIRPSAEEVMKHPMFWGDNGIGLYMTILDGILRSPIGKDEPWRKIFEKEKSTNSNDQSATGNNGEQNSTMNQSNLIPNPKDQSAKRNNGWKSSTRMQSNLPFHPKDQSEKRNNGGKSSTRKQSNLPPEMDWRPKAKALLADMKESQTYTCSRKCFVRFLRNLFAHFHKILAAKNIIKTREGFGEWVLLHFEKLFFDIFLHSFRHMDEFYQIVSR